MMEANFYLVIQGRRAKYAPRDSGRRELGEVQIRKKKPSTRQDEIAVKIELTIPDTLFEKPTLQIAASVPEDGGRGPVITTEVADNIANIIRQQIGVEVRISADPGKPPRENVDAVAIDRINEFRKSLPADAPQGEPK